MLFGRVVGTVWSSRKVDEMPPGKLAIVELGDDSERIVAFDPLTCGEGEYVLVTTGSACSNYFTNNVPIDAVIVASLD